MNMDSYNCDSVGELSALLKVISDHSRLQLLCLLNKGEQCVCQLMAHLKLSQSLISHHLKDLKDAGLVIDRKDGQRVYYSLTFKGKNITKLIFQIHQ